MKLLGKRARKGDEGAIKLVPEEGEHGLCSPSFLPYLLCFCLSYGVHGHRRRHVACLQSYP